MQRGTEKKKKKALAAYTECKQKHIYICGTQNLFCFFNQPINWTHPVGAGSTHMLIMY